ncbi:hypothetical protein LQW54_010652 [Pestalotiopsis sp. IQ-011]
MDGHSSQPLTRDNLNNHDGGRAAQTYRVSCVRADVARQQLYQLLWTLGRIGPRGQHILKGLDVYIAAPQNVRCRESSIEEPDPNDVQYWEDKLQSYRDRYTPVIQLEEAKGRVYSEMMVLHQFGRDGARALAQDELYIAGPYDVRRAADRHSNAPLEDVCYWNEKWQHFHNVVETLKSACPRVPSPAALTINGSPAMSYASDDEATSAGRQNKVEAWITTHIPIAVARKRENPKEDVFRNQMRGRTSLGSTQRTSDQTGCIALHCLQQQVSNSLLPSHRGCGREVAIPLGTKAKFLISRAGRSV